ncbi:MAG: hypothetical protein AAFU67_07430, partial [Bacteroidota bacterium]
MGVPNPGVGEAFTFYTSFADAENGGVAGQIADPAAYVATLGTTTIFARLTNSTTGCFDITSFTVTVNPLPTVDITGELEICAGETTTLVASGGTSFQWDEDAGSSTNDTVMVTPSVTTTYSVTVTDDNGCMASDSVTVIVNPLPTASITVSESSGAADDDGTICEGDEATLTAAGGAVFSWSTGASTQSITVSPEVTTTYIVTVTDINGCSDTASQEIIVDPLPTFDSLTVSATEVCQDESVDFTLNGLLDLETTVTYTISDGVNPDETETITGTPVGGMAVIPSVVAPGPGTYTITIDQITIGDCSIIPTENNVVVVLVKPNPTIAGITADPTEICVGDDITFTAAGLLNGPATFDYEVYVAGVITPILTGEDVPVVATDSMATIMASDLFPDLSLVPPGAYSVVVTSITVNGCETTTFEAGSNVAFFLVNPLPVFADGEPANLTECEIVEGGGTAIFDLEEAVELSLADNLSITFHTSMMDAEAGQNAIIDVNAYESGTTDIFARIEDLFTGCFDVASFTINVLSLPMVSIEAVDDICEGSETPVDLVGTPMGGTFSGTGVDADSSQFDPTGLTAGDYIVTYTFLEVGSGCVNTAEITITIVPNPIVEITAPIMEICVGESVTLTASGAVTYEWTNDIDDSVLAGESITVSPSVTTIYTVVGTDENGCTGMAMKTITVNPLPTAMIVAENQEECASVEGGNTAEFDLSSIVVVSADTTVSFHTSATDAMANLGAIQNPTTYVGNNGQEIFYRLADINGCVAFGSFILTVNPLPAVSFGALPDVCAGSTETIDLTGFVSPAGGVFSGAGVVDTVFDPTGLAAGNYVLTYTVTDSKGCMNSATSNVEVLPMPTAGITVAENSGVAPNDSTICLGDEVTLTATGGGTYLWEDNTTTNPIRVVMPTETTTYMVTVTAA